MAKKRWACPNGKHPGVLAPERMKPDDIRRYCIPCSLKAKRLLQRIAPALLRTQAEKTTARHTRLATRRSRAADRHKRAAERETARWTFDGVDMRDELRRMLKLPAFRDVSRELSKVQVVVHRGSDEHSTGHHKLYRGKIHVTVGTGAWYLGSEVLLHELAHAAHQMLGLTRRRARAYRLPSGRSGVAIRHDCHNQDFHDLLRRAACQAYALDAGRVAELHKEAGGYPKAYAMDQALRIALKEKYGAARTPAEERTRHLRKKAANRYWKELPEGRFEAELPALSIQAINAEDWTAHTFDEEDPAFALVGTLELESRRRGRGATFLVRGTTEHFAFLDEELRHRLSLDDPPSWKAACTVARTRLKDLLGHTRAATTRGTT